MNTAQSRLNILSPLQPKSSTYFASHLSTHLHHHSHRLVFSGLIGLFFLILFPTSYHSRKSKLLAALQLTHLPTPPSRFQFSLLHGELDAIRVLQRTCDHFARGA